MTSAHQGRPEPASAQPRALLDALLYSASHDLRSPLLTMSLGAELIAEALPRDGTSGEGEAATVALDSLQHGAKDLERMLQALTLLSRAGRRTLQEAPASLHLLLGGHLVISDDDALRQRSASVDPASVHELIDYLCGDQPAEIHLATDQSHVMLRIPMTQIAPEFEGSPLTALAESLQRYSGTPVERLAVSQLLLERQGATLAVEQRSVLLWLPLEGAERSSIETGGPAATEVGA